MILNFKAEISQIGMIKVSTAELDPVLHNEAKTEIKIHYIYVYLPLTYEYLRVEPNFNGLFYPWDLVKCPE